MLWISSERSIRGSVRSAMSLAKEYGYRSIAFPLIGAGTGGGKDDKVEKMMSEEFESISFVGEVLLVKYVPAV